MKQTKTCSRREFLRWSALAAAGSALAACAPAPTPETIEIEKTVVVEQTVEVPVQVTVEPEKIRDTNLPFKYSPPSSVNNGEAITLDVWDYSSAREALWDRWLAKFTEAYPNVTFNRSKVSWGDYWTKAMASIPAGEAPDLLFFHGGQQEAMVWGGMFEPWPETLFPPEQMKATFPAVASVMGPEGRIYWIPTGTMTAGILYNKDILEEAGYTGADIPDTWDEFMEFAKELTRYDASGRVEISGFNVNGAWDSTYQFPFYQQGSFHWDEGYSRLCVNQEPMQKTLQFLWDVNHVHRTSEDDFLTATESIENQVCAMRLAWTVSVGSLKSNRPDLNFGVVRVPTWTGDPSPAYGVGSPDPQSFGVPVTTAGDRKEVAFEVIAWLYSNPDFLLDNSLTLNTPPSTPQIADHPLLAQNETIEVLAPVTEWAVPSGLGVPEVEQVVLKEWLWDGIFLSGMDIQEALTNCQASVDETVETFLADFELHATEHTYSHADLMKLPHCLS